MDYGDVKRLAGIFDYTNLSPWATAHEIESLCQEALDLQLYAVCVNPSMVSTARKALGENHYIKLVSVCGFPLGANRPTTKQREASLAVEEGADEIDMVANLSWLFDRQFGRVTDEIQAVRDALSEAVVLKVIIECGRLQEDLWANTIESVIDGGAQFVKTSTGFYGGTTPEEVKQLARFASGRIAIKASGGIRTLEQSQKLLRAGATRLGSSAAAKILKELLATT